MTTGYTIEAEEAAAVSDKLRKLVTVILLLLILQVVISTAIKPQISLQMSVTGQTWTQQTSWSFQVAGTISQTKSNITDRIYIPQGILSVSIRSNGTIFGRVPLTVSFTRSVSGGIQPYHYNWSFGDGETSNSANPSHTYTVAGTYTVSLFVNDSNRPSSAASSNPLTVNVNAQSSQGWGIIADWKFAIVFALAAAIVIVFITRRKGVDVRPIGGKGQVDVKPEHEAGGVEIEDTGDDAQMEDIHVRLEIEDNQPTQDESDIEIG